MRIALIRLACVIFAATFSFAAAPPQSDRHISSDEIRARLIETPKPDYPEIARRLHHTGTGVYGLYFDVRGEVSGIRIFKRTGHPELDIAALKGLVRWRAKPGPKWKVKLPVTFILTKRMETYVNPYHFDYHF
jgi:TonB family protein